MEIPLHDDKYEIAIFAGGCFWCMEPPFDKLEGVISTTVGYCGGKEEYPTYHAVASGRTGHAESILIKYDPKKIRYEKLLETFWHNINPTQKNGQFYDRGPQYRTAIFYLNEEQKKAAEKSKQELEKSGKFKEPIVTEIVPATKFWRAEEYHQDYYKKEPDHYLRYKRASGREDFKKKVWGNTSE
ncbi:MAG: peptide-methionine (S)-S-oxide reductase [Candidatus Hydrogenedentota bacterium]|nr:MAG: peptide-methionine (S)-S-oxide reductase [Candidatus Hydrogenedentota bacterium]